VINTSHVPAIERLSKELEEHHEAGNNLKNEIETSIKLRIPNVWDNDDTNVCVSIEKKTITVEYYKPSPASETDCAPTTQEEVIDNGQSSDAQEGSPQGSPEEINGTGPGNEGESSIEKG
jgi:hypothetical protein